MTCKWLITMVIVSPLSRVVPLINGRTPWLINGGDPNYLRYLGSHPPSRHWGLSTLFAWKIKASL